MTDYAAIAKIAKDLPNITVAPCPCGRCSDYHLVGIGKFVQGSGFTKNEAILIAALLNKSRKELLAHDSRYDRERQA